MMNACTRWSFLAVPVLAAFGCSDPVPLPAQGAVSLGISPDAGGTCPISAGMGYQIGAAKKVGTVTTVQAPNDITPGVSVIDGDHGASVSCSVVKQGDGSFKFSGSLHAFSGDGNLVTVTMTNGLINADKANGTGQVSVFTTQLVGTFDSGAMPCTFNVINSQVKGGSIWTDFTCPSISQAGQRACSISKSTIVFENCSGS